MFGVGLPELFVILVLMLIPYGLVYSAHRSNEKQKRPPKVWAAVLLTLLPGQVGGLLYAAGLGFASLAFIAILLAIIAIALVSDAILGAAGVSNKAAMMLPGMLPLLIILIVAVLAGILANRKAQELHDPAKQPDSRLPAERDTEKRLSELHQLHNKGLITNEEYERKRASILEGL